MSGTGVGSISSTGKLNRSWPLDQTIWDAPGVRRTTGNPSSLLIGPTIEISRENHSMKFRFVSVMIAAFVLFPDSVPAHSGGLNAQGCHGGSRPYHCHRSPSEMIGNRLRCDLGSRSRECAISTGTGNAISSQDILEMQQELMRHCSSLSSQFADGRFGPATRRALRQFQASYGLAPDGIFGSQTAVALAGPVTGVCK